MLTRHADDGSYELKNAGTGDCADVPYSSTQDGQAVGRYTCTGTDGAATQAKDTGTSGQRWSATAN